MIAQKIKNKEARALRNNYSKGELAKEILKALGGRGILAASLALPNLPQVLKFLGVVGAKDRYRAKRTIYNRKNKRLINFYENGIIEITEKGKRKFYDMTLKK